MPWTHPRTCPRALGGYLGTDTYDHARRRLEYREVAFAKVVDQPGEADSGPMGDHGRWKVNLRKESDWSEGPASQVQVLYLPPLH